MTHQTQRHAAGWKLENSYKALPDKFYAELELNKVTSPEIVTINEDLANSLGLDVKELQSKDGLNVLAGNSIPDDATPIAQAYAGHQFGNFTMLGDGRALLIGEQITPDGDRFDIQLKGSGRTPYSRGGDGRAALGPMLREYIVSEAMYALGIPTSRSLAVLKTGDPVYREVELEGAILTRVASSHLRVGTFEYAFKWGTKKDLQALADYAIDRHFAYIDPGKNKYLSLFQEVMKRQANLVAKWQLVGFIHGVMNTDNVTISGESIDYGPCAFMDSYDPKTVFSSIDVQGRYAYGNQPSITGWNLARFAETLLPLLHEDQSKAVEMAQEELYRFSDLYHANWLNGMRSKLGIFTGEQQDVSLIEDLLHLMEEHEADYTNTFRALTFEKFEGMKLFESKEFNDWYKRWQERLENQTESKQSINQLMQENNPAVIPRNHRVEEALKAAVEKGDYSVMDQLVCVLSDPYAHSDEQEPYTTLPEPSAKPYVTYCGT
ncbi:protein adenylyltransferase SelO [Gracilibacillus sp. YIM 98692]|uniref:protein adenylyltransferase SelO n=1 Tax=Gracilibacillus sp. YIM 98692 TaxID=2663532 RepID=UPI0013D45BE0|nr:YdiU family protein [Gracilibacillus sp. YIM 98692]